MPKNYLEYNPSKIEKKWQKAWEKSKLYQTKDQEKGKENYYHLVMFAYSSGDLHMGHWFNYAPADVFARYKKMNGYNVMSPFGFDAFGLPAENAAIQRNINPRDWAYSNIENMRKQVKSIGTIFDWSREVITSEPDYYKWTQWIFLKLYEKGLAYRDKITVNWCPTDKTVLANEQVLDGRCERDNTPVVQKELEQWLFKITDYSEKLLKGLETIDWPETSKIAQKNWIGKSEGAEIHFLVPNSKETIPVFTTRADTLFGATYLVLAPEHSMVLKITKDEQLGQVARYIEDARKKSEHERLHLDKDKTGVFTGGYIFNPINNEKIPVWVADYVIGWYGTGSIMAVPAHDERDFEFAQKYKLPIKKAVVPKELQSIPRSALDVAAGAKDLRIEADCYTGDGNLINSDKFNGLSSVEARKKIIEELQKKKLAEFKVNYRMHDWIISRQRYWGAPIPMIRCKECGWVPVPEKDLPVELPPLDDYKPTEDARSPLAKAKDWLKVKCPKCAGDAERETDTMDTFVDSAWYFLRYPDPKNKKELFDKLRVNLWMPVDAYIGGAEHVTKHLLYARFINMFLHDNGYVQADEPFSMFRHQGLILGPDGQKMSKSRGNIVNPDEVVQAYGADSVRMYLCFMGPYEQGGPWNPKGINGTYRFLNRVWKLTHSIILSRAKRGEGSKQIEKSLNKTIKKVGEDIENFRFNTAVSELMKLLNLIEENNDISKEQLETFLKILAPFAPFLAEELWEQLGGKKSVHLEGWPEYDPALIKEKKVDLIVQINGKTRGVVVVPADSHQKDVEELAKADEKIKKYLAGQDIKKVIFVQNRLINFLI